MKTIEEVQQDNIDLLIELDRVCSECNINYSISFGTLLGCIRHGGFIPWDDDVDVCMDRKDYVRFIKAAPKQLGPDFYFDCFELNKNYPYNFGKLKDRRKPYCEYAMRNTPGPHHFGIDVFPIDNTFRITYRLQNHFAYFWEHCRWKKLGVDDEATKTWYVRIFSAISPIKFINFRCLMAQKMVFLRTRTQSLIGQPGDILVFQSDLYFPLVRRDFVFRNQKYRFLTPQNFDKNLTFCYGDWRTPVRPKSPGRQHTDYLEEKR